VKFSLKDPNIVWIAGSGTYKSTDSGKSWKGMFPFNKTIGSIAIDPTDSNIVYAAEGFTPRIVIKWVKGMVWKTTNGGKDWKELPRPSGELSKDSTKQRNYSTIIIDPNSKYIPGKGHQRVYLMGRGGLFRSDDAGNSWIDLSTPFLPGATSDLVLINKDKRSILFAAIIPCKGNDKGGIYKSVDNGKSWVVMNKGIEGLINKLKNHPLNKKIISNRNTTTFPIMLGNATKDPNRLYLGTALGMARSDDMGKSWVILAGEQDYIKDREGKYTSARKTDRVFKLAVFGGVCGVHRISVSPTNPDIVIFTDMNDVYISYDAGKTWRGMGADFVKQFDDTLMQKYPPNRYTWSIKSRGYQNVVSDSVAVDPFNHNIIYAAYMDLGLQISRDGGVSWEHPTKGLPSRGHTWSVAVDPKNKGLVFVTLGGQKWRQPQGGIFRSKDFGVTWEKVGLNESFIDVINSVVIDYNSPVKSRVIYLATETQGVYKSSDTGTTWKNITRSLGNKNLQKTVSIVVDPNSSNIVYLGTKKGLYISNDAGKSWKLSGDHVFEKVESISVSKKGDKTIYISAHLPGQNKFWGKRHFWKSTDEGKSWKDITPEYIKFAGGIVVNPYDSNYVYAATYLVEKSDKTQKSVIVKSKDGGKTWERIDNKIAFSRGRHIIIDSNNPKHLFILCRFGIIEAWDEEAPVK
jgi:photosystem II stability/assembly factor-like uncharacterized protein